MFQPPPSSHSAPGWTGSHSPAFGLMHGCCYNLCKIVTSCFYVFCCCWLLEDCFGGRRRFSGPSYAPPDSPPPPPPPFGRHGPYGTMEPGFGPPSGPSPFPPPPRIL